MLFRSPFLVPPGTVFEVEKEHGLAAGAYIVTGVLLNSPFKREFHYDTRFIDQSLTPSDPIVGAALRYDPELRALMKDHPWGLKWQPSATEDLLPWMKLEPRDVMLVFGV